jgi:hypothetical protein
VPHRHAIGVPTTTALEKAGFRLETVYNLESLTTGCDRVS